MSSIWCFISFLVLSSCDFLILSFCYHLGHPYRVLPLQIWLKLPSALVPDRVHMCSYDCVHIHQNDHGDGHGDVSEHDDDA